MCVYTKFSSNNTNVSMREREMRILFGYRLHVLNYVSCSFYMMRTFTHIYTKIIWIV